MVQRILEEKKNMTNKYKILKKDLGSSIEKFRNKIGFIIARKNYKLNLGLKNA